MEVSRDMRRDMNTQKVLIRELEGSSMNCKNEVKFGGVTQRVEISWLDTHLYKFGSRGALGVLT